jgi:translation initiation factor 3 subunit H
MIAVERASGRGKAILAIHDASRASGGDLSVKTYKLSDGARAAAQERKWDTAT